MKIKPYSIFSIDGTLGRDENLFIKYTHPYAVFQRYYYEWRLDTRLTRLLYLSARV